MPMEGGDGVCRFPVGVGWVGVVVIGSRFLRRADFQGEGVGNIFPGRSRADFVRQISGAQIS